MFKKSLANVIFLVAFMGGLIHLLNSTLGFIVPLQMRPLHLCIVSVLAVLVDVLKNTDKKFFVPRCILNLFLLLLAIVGTSYIALNYVQIAKSAGRVSSEVVIYATMTVITILIITWNTVGSALPLIAVFFILYSMFGYLIPGALGHRGYSFSRTMYFLYTNGSAIFGVPIDTSVRYLVLFMIMGEFIERSGTGKLFMAFSDLIAKHTRGGAAKASLVSGALFGCISGTPIANIMVTGTFTIPMMLRSGISKTFAAAVSAAAGTGGLIMPPIMGSGAFMMADLLGIPYTQIMVAAIIPAVMYYLSLYWAVDFHAAKNKVEYFAELEDSKLYRQIFIYAHTILPLLFFIGSVMLGYSIFRSAIVCIVITPFVAAIRKETRMNVKGIVAGIAAGMRNTVTLGMTTACAGIIVGIISLTGFGFSFSDFLNYFREIPSLAFITTMVICMIMGMGMPSVASYLLTATIAAPPLIEMGFNALAVHMFIFYFSAFASITPPVALASFTAAGIADSDPFKTGYASFKLAIVAFLCPFIFVYSPGILGQGASFSEILLLLPSMLIGTYSFTCGIQGYLSRSINNMFLRILLIGGGLLMIVPGKVTDLAGFVIVIATYFINKKMKK